MSGTGYTEQPKTKTECKCADQTNTLLADEQQHTSFNKTI